MTLSEFKAWFEGFTEGMEAAPTEAQFSKIKAKVALIDGAPVTYPIFVDRYVPQYWPHNGYPWGYPITSVGGFTLDATASDAGKVTFGQFSYAPVEPASKGDSQTVPFDSITAMRDLGRAESVN